MRENRLSGSEGGATLIPSSLPLSITRSLRDKTLPRDPSTKSTPHHGPKSGGRRRVRERVLPLRPFHMTMDSNDTNQAAYAVRKSGGL